MPEVRNNSNMTFVNWFPSDKVEDGTLSLDPKKNIHIKLDFGIAYFNNKENKCKFYKYST